jgi:hypothetical protein
MQAIKCMCPSLLQFQEGSPPRLQVLSWGTVLLERCVSSCHSHRPGRALSHVDMFVNIIYHKCFPGTCLAYQVSIQTNFDNQGEYIPTGNQIGTVPLNDR